MVATLQKRDDATMQDLVTALDKELRYIMHEIQEEKIILHVESTREEAKCPYCGKVSDRIHSHYERRLQDLPISGKKVRIVLRNKKYFCRNRTCPHKTFAESYAFYEPKATKTKRLQEEILRASLTQSSTSAAKYLRGSVAEVGKSTICGLLKKRRDDARKERGTNSVYR